MRLNYIGRATWEACSWTMLDNETVSWSSLYKFFFVYISTHLRQFWLYN
jgi:hypothetical protein